MRFKTLTDDLLAATLLPIIPRSVTPNQVSWLRIASLPFIYYFLATGQYMPGFFIFVIAALTDALDGAMARKRDQVTETGKILDAVADRGLITLLALVFIPRYFGWLLFIAIIVFELLNAGAAYRSRRKLGFNPGANWGGKVKMVIQCIAFGVLFAALIWSAPAWPAYANWLLWFSLVFALLQSFLYPRVESAAHQ